MDLKNPMLNSSMNQHQSYADLNQLDSLRQEAKKNPHKALKAVAHQFEAIFMQKLLAEMRKANSQFASKDSVNNNRYVKNYQQMYDKQISMDLSKNGSLGLADLIVQQLDPDSANITPASQLRAGQLPMGKQFKHLQQSSTGQQVGKNVAVNQTMEFKPRRVYTNHPVTPPVETEKTATKRQQFASKEDFVNKLLPIARQFAAPAGISPLAVVAQAALETGWGQRVMAHSHGDSSHNLFGIKVGSRWQGPRVNVKTLEYENGVAQPKREHFRAYSSFAESVKDYVELMKKPRYQHALAQGEHPAEFAKQLQKAGYATDPHYADKMKRILDSEVFSPYQQ